MGISTNIVHLATRHTDKSTVIDINGVEFPIKLIRMNTNKIILVADGDVWKNLKKLKIKIINKGS